ncbi:M23 family metallopeptidase [Gordonia sihwensis]|uniref:M23 family metallopeptidase n=1 Tax=Gordonia TaxID=2053 RepID=UPI0024174116|nr:M23 family metallopeptidase [Gordonia sihwensis]WFN94400.1 M23 family metallopeptidase [Gordonia sihwensis]
MRSLDTRRRATAIALVCASALPAGPGAASAQRAYHCPLAPRPPVVRGFDPPAERWLAGHRGVDLGAPAESAVVAARAGTVTFAGPVAGRSTVTVLHPDGISTTYEPVVPRVRRGEHIRTGQLVGVLQTGHEGCSATACLHWGARRGSGRSVRYLNPLSLLGLSTVRLKPPR